MEVWFFVGLLLAAALLIWFKGKLITESTVLGFLTGLAVLMAIRCLNLSFQVGYPSREGFFLVIFSAFVFFLVYADRLKPKNSLDLLGELSVFVVSFEATSRMFVQYDFAFGGLAAGTFLVTLALVVPVMLLVSGSRFIYELFRNNHSKDLEQGIAGTEGYKQV